MSPGTVWREGAPAVTLCRFSRIRSGWIYSKTFSPDLALARLDRRIAFSEYVAPICVPASPGDVDDVPADDGQEMKAYVAGWGATFSQCDSNFHGPSPHAMCKFPFVYNGRVYRDCAMTPPPSADNKAPQRAKPHDTD